MKSIRALPALAVLVLAAVLAVACARSSPEPEGALARFEGGTVLPEALDAKILALPADQRHPEDGDYLAWYERLVREIALERILLEEARSAGLDDYPEVLEQIAETERQLVVASCIASAGDAPESATEEELEQAYEAHLDDFAQPLKRQLLHIFKRVEQGGDPTAALGELAAIAERAANGESFRDLATTHSDSESRHRGGMMGWFPRGQLPPALEREVFALEVQQPSSPITTATGVHLFWVDSESAATSPSLNQIRPQLTQRVLAEKRLEHARSLVTIEPPSGSVIPEPESLPELLATGDGELLILRVGEFDLSLGDLERRAAEASATTLPAVVGLIDALTVRELLYRQCSEEILASDSAVSAALVSVRERGMVEARMKQGVLAEIRAQQGDLQAYFERNQRRYTEPLLLRLTRLAVPLGTAANERLGELERAVESLDAGDLELAGLAETMGGTVEELGWKRLSELQSDSGAMGMLAVRLSPGGHSAPYVRGKAAEILRLDERKEPVLLPLSRVEPRVAEDILAHRGAEYFATYSERLLAAKGFEILSGLAAAVPGTAAEEPHNPRS